MGHLKREHNTWIHRALLECGLCKALGKKRTTLRQNTTSPVTMRQPHLRSQTEAEHLQLHLESTSIPQPANNHTSFPIQPRAMLPRPVHGSDHIVKQPPPHPLAVLRQTKRSFQHSTLCRPRAVRRSVTAPDAMEEGRNSPLATHVQPPNQTVSGIIFVLVERGSKFWLQKPHGDRGRSWQRSSAKDFRGRRFARLRIV